MIKITLLSWLFVSGCALLYCARIGGALHKVAPIFAGVVFGCGLFSVMYVILGLIYGFN